MRGIRTEQEREADERETQERERRYKKTGDMGIWDGECRQKWVG
jgi:hypothetical protein